jgi:hypothetical protein
MRKLLPFLFAIVASAQLTPDQTRQFEAADLRILRLPPSAFPALPSTVRTDLTRRGCTIPQTRQPEPHNVIRGQFVERGQFDWAVLCSVKRVSTVLVYRKDSPSKPMALARRADIALLIAEDDMPFTRFLNAVDRSYILSHDYAHVAPAIDHEGINDGFLEKASVIHYRYKGKWLELSGAD